MKAAAKIQFELLLDEESKEKYKTMTDEEVQKFIEHWKMGIEGVLRDEVNDDITNLSIDIKIIPTQG